MFCTGFLERWNEYSLIFEALSFDILGPICRAVIRLRIVLKHLCELIHMPNFSSQNLSPLFLSPEEVVGFFKACQERVTCPNCASFSPAHCIVV